MSRRFDDAIRLGVGILIAAAVAGLLVLVLQGRAHADDDLEHERLAALLEPGESAGGAAARVDRLLAEDRSSRLGAAARVALDAAWKAGSRRSLSGAVSGARGLVRAVGVFRDRTEAEREALRILEAEARTGPEESGLRALREELFDRAQHERLRKRVEAIEDALEDSDLTRARIGLSRLREEAPFHPRLGDLEAAFAELEESRARSIDSMLRVRHEAAPGEVSRLQSLLLGRPDELCDGQDEDVDLALACAAALVANGQRADALPVLERLTERAGESGDLAERWLRDPRIHPEREWRRAQRLQRIRTALGWLGGATLEQNGLDLSSRGLRAWRSTVSPLNLALSVPIRVMRRRDADSAPIRRLALDYVEYHPEGPAVDEAEAWISRTDPTPQERRRASLFDDGVLVLPKARTPYLPVAARPVLLTRSLLLRLDAPTAAALADRIPPDAAALILDPVDGAPGAGADPSFVEGADALVRSIAEALERNRARSVSGPKDQAIEALRHLDRGLRDGGRIVARPWSPETPEGERPSLLSVLEGDPASVGGVAVERGKDGMSFGGSLTGRALDCPAGHVCLDRTRRVESRMFAGVDVDGGARLGVETRVRGASLRLEVTAEGPHASLNVAVASLLGFDRWLPLHASFAVGLYGIHVAPRLAAR